MPNIVESVSQVQASLADNEYLGQSWHVHTTKSIKRMRDKIQNGEMIDELIDYLANHGPILRRGDDLSKRFRNFSPLSRTDFHCHLGDSNEVVVWKADKESKTITIYYLGNHPTTYKSIVRY